MPSSDATRIPAHAASKSKICASELMRTPSAVERAAEVLADDRADHREHARDLERGEDERQRGRDAHAPPDLEVARGVRAHQLDLARARALQAAQRVDHHRQEAEDGGDRHLRVRRERVEPDAEDRGERDDRDRVRGDRDRHQRVADACGSGRRASPRAIPSAGADREAAERLLERVPAGRPERVPVGPERLDDVARLREQELLDVERARSCPATAAMTSTKTTSAGAHSPALRNVSVKPAPPRAAGARRACAAARAPR